MDTSASSEGPQGTGEGCGCTRFFVDCEDAARFYEQALEAYLAGREEWGKTMVAYYLWHKRRGDEDATARDD